MSTALERAIVAELAAERELGQVPEWIWDRERLPVPIDEIADSHYGLLVQESGDLAGRAGLGGGMHVSGLLLPAPREIWIDADEAAKVPARRRFTVGHELGHWVLHCDLGRAGSEPVHCRGETMSEEASVEEKDGRPQFVKPTRFPPAELDANQFAAALLMPRATVEREHAWLDGNKRRMAQTFGVSVVAMELRLWFLARVAQLERG